MTQLQVKLQKTKEITFLEENKEETRYCLTYLEVTREQKKYD